MFKCLLAKMIPAAVWRRPALHENRQELHWNACARDTNQAASSRNGYERRHAHCVNMSDLIQHEITITSQ